MRILVQKQEEVNELWTIALNNCFTSYIESLIDDYGEDLAYRAYGEEDDNFILPGRIELRLDGYTSYIEVSADILIALYQIISIKNEELKTRLMEGKDVDLREYR